MWAQYIFEKKEWDFFVQMAQLFFFPQIIHKFHKFILKYTVMKEVHKITSSFFNYIYNVISATILIKLHFLELKHYRTHFYFVFHSFILFTNTFRKLLHYIKLITKNRKFRTQLRQLVDNLFQLLFDWLFKIYI